MLRNLLSGNFSSVGAIAGTTAATGAGSVSSVNTGVATGLSLGAAVLLYVGLRYFRLIPKVI